MLIPSLIFILLLGLCVGSFLNVVVYRLPLGKSLVHPPSTCPKCNTRLAWHDNVPVLGWLWLGGKCRTCKLPISIRYPTIEALTGLLFLGYALALFHFGFGPSLPGAAAGGPAISEFGVPLAGVARSLPDIARDWPILAIHLPMLAILLAASLIDLETFTIPISLNLTMAVIGLGGHTLLMSPTTLGNLCISESLALPAALATLGYVLTLLLFYRRIIPLSFPHGEPMMLDHATWQKEVDDAKAEGRDPQVDPDQPPLTWTRGMLNREMMKEVTFITLPLVGFVLGFSLNKLQPTWGGAISTTPYLNAFLGAALAGLIGGGVIWAIRILGTVGFGKLAMGLGDVHLMAAVGTCAGGFIASLALFPAALWGLLFTAYAAIFKSRREIPFGPYLALGTLTLLLVHAHLERYFAGIFP